MSSEFDYPTLRGLKFISFKKKEDDEIIGTRILNPLLKKFWTISMLVLQTDFYKEYDNIGKWKKSG